MNTVFSGVVCLPMTQPGIVQHSMCSVVSMNYDTPGIVWAHNGKIEIAGCWREHTCM